MSLSDSAEYWWDVKAHRTYTGPYFVHMPNSSCGHFKPRINCDSSEWINDISCHACKKMIEKDGNIYGLKEGISPREQSVIDKEKNKFKHGKCPKCNSPLRERLNRKTNIPFLGCSNYPSCKHTQNKES